MSALPTLPRIVVGTSHLGSVLPWSGGDEQTFRYLDGLVELGLSAFDLAASYQIGGTERLFGNWLKSRGLRGRITLITKGGHPLPVVAPHRLGRRALESDLNASLLRLRTETVDVYALHRDDGWTPLSEIAETLLSFFKAGKIRAWGLSNWAPSRIAALSAVAEEIGLPPIFMSSPQFSLFGWSRPPWPGCESLSEDGSAREYYEAHGLRTLAWSPLGAGALGKGGLRGTVYDTPENHGRLQRLGELARNKGHFPGEVALAYLLAQPFVVHPIVGSKSLGRMRENLRSLDVSLSAEEVRWLREGDA